MFPQSSIKRLRFAFTAMAGLTVLALIVGCITFALSYAAQKQFIGETAPLLVNIERLSKVAVGFSSTSRELETITTRWRLDSVLARYRRQSELLKMALLDLAKNDLNPKTVKDLNDVLREMGEHRVLFGEALSTNIEARKRLATLRRGIKDEGQRLQDQLSPLVLEASLELIDLVHGPNGRDIAEPQALAETLNEVQLLTDISFATERFLQIVGYDDFDDPSSLSPASLKSLKSAFHHLTQLVLKLRDEEKRQTIALSLRLFNENWQEAGGIADQYQYLSNAVALFDTLSQQRSLLLTRMTGLMDRIVDDGRTRFFDDAETARKRSLIAIVTLALLSLIALAAAIWIGWRLINRDIAQRLDQLATSTVALAGGDLDVTIDQSGSDELADMARAAEIFRRNARELRRTEAELADRLLDVEGANEKLLKTNVALDLVNAELAESELRYQLAVNGSSVGIWDWDAQTNTLFWSSRLKQMTGLTDQELEPEFSWFVERLHPDDRELVMEQRRRHLEEGADYDVECRLRRGDSSYVWLHIRGQAVWESDGEPKRMAGSADDITDRKLVEINLAQYAKELERSNRELDDFAYIASHDLKEPLRAIFNHASFLLEDYQDKLEEDAVTRLHRMIKLSKRMEQLIADLLYFSRLGRGDQAMETLDLNKVIANIVGSLDETLKSRNARIEISESLPLVSGHPAHITTLFQNLISNASKYNDADERVVEIGMAPSIQDADTPPHCTLFVRDNGIGIEECFLTDIFRIFKRLNSDKAYGEGTGAGLTFAKKIVENHGGDIWLESEPGNGTTFFFTLKTAA